MPLIYFFPVDIVKAYSSVYGPSLQYLPKSLHRLILTSVAAYCLYLLGDNVRKWNVNLQRKQKYRRDSAARLRQAEATVQLLEIAGVGDPLVRLSLVDLQKELQMRITLPSHALAIYQLQALNKHELTNGIAEILDVSDLHNAAIVLDSVRPTDMGELHGIPVSLEQAIQVKDVSSPLGLCSHLSYEATDDAVIVKVLKHQGAIPFMMTNVSQGSIFCASSNPLAGQILNPWNNHRSPGGSCCGEAAMLACNGSIVGLGLDWGGNLRVPAHFCGVCSLKPTSSRLSKVGVKQLCTGQNIVPASVGPIARDVTGLAVMMKALCIPKQRELDPYCYHGQFDMQIFESKQPLKIGFLDRDGMAALVPAVRKVLNKSIAILKELGHVVVRFEPPDMMNVLRMFLMSLNGDDSYRLVKELCTDHLDGSLRWLYAMLQTPHLVRLPLAFGLGYQDPIKKLLIGLQPPSEVGLWWDLADEVAMFRLKFLEQWKDQELDVLLCPVMPHAAVMAGTEASFLSSWSYIGLFSVLDYPAGTVPVGVVTEKDLRALSNPTIYPQDKPMDVKIRKDQEGLTDNPESSSEGLPVSLQIAGLPYNEELVLRVMLELETNSKEIPGTPRRRSTHD